MSTEVKKVDVYLIMQSILGLIGLSVTVLLLLMQPALQNLSEYISHKGLWIAGMVCLISSTLFGYLNKHKNISQCFIFIALISLITLLLSEIL